MKPIMIAIPARNKLGHDFEIGKFPVTQAEFEAVMGYNPSYFENQSKSKQE